MPDHQGTSLAMSLSRLKQGRTFRIFPTEQQLSGEDSIDWSGTFDTFLAFAQEAGVKTLYVSEWKHDEGAPGEELGGDVEIGFLLDGRMHVFSTMEFSEEGEQEEEAEGAPNPTLRAEEIRKIRDALESSTPGLIDAFVSSVTGKEEPPPDPDAEWGFRAAFVDFLAKKFDLTTFPSDRVRVLSMFGNEREEPLPADIEIALNRAVKQAAGRVREFERNLTQGLATKGVAWAKERDIPLRSLNFPRVKEFAESEGVHLSRSGARELRDRIVQAIKRGEPQGSHH